MAFKPTDIGFDPGLYGNRSKLASKGRWVDGNLVRFPDKVPQQMGGWLIPPVSGAAVLGRARDMIAWRPNSQVGRYSAIGTHSNVYQFDGGAVVDITPAGFVVGRADSIIGAGFGAGLYSAGAFGTPRAGSGNVLDAAFWSFDMFGEVLLGCYSADGIIYDYEPGDPRLIALVGAPTARSICVSDERHVFAFGGGGDPTFVQWSDREDRNQWTPGSTTRAGGYQMQVTSAFQCGKRCRGQVLGWTSTEVFGFTPTFNSLVYDRERLGTQCGVMGPHSVCVVSDSQDEVAYWMSPYGFHLYNGRVQMLDCDLFDYVFKDLNLIQRVKFQARTNAAFGEVWFFYCSAASNEIDRAVVYDYRNGVWTKATISRLAWLDAGIFPLPLAVDGSGVIYEHENGTTAAGAALPSYILSHPLQFGGGEQFCEIRSFWPDMEPLSGTCALTIVGRDYPGAADQLFGPYNFTPADEKLDLAIATRQVQLKIAGVSGYWELGVPRIEVQGGGLR